MNLRMRFRDYYQNSKTVRDQLMKSGTFVLDTNILLNFYRVPKSSRESLLNDLSSHQEQLWMPFQTAVELHDNCDKVRSEQTEKHAERIKKVVQFANQMSNIEKRSRLEETEEQKQALEAVEKWRSKLEAELKEIEEEIHHQKPDEILERIADIYATRIGDEPDESKMQSMTDVAKTRFEKKIPPGFEDSSKPGDEGYGDYFFWQQILDYASEAKRDIVLVTDDKKEDWQMKLNGSSIRPRPELIEEFQKTTGQHIVILDSSEFFYHLTKDTASPSSEEARNDFNEAVQSLKPLLLDDLPSDVIDRGRSIIDTVGSRRYRPSSQDVSMEGRLSDIPPAMSLDALSVDEATDYKLSFDVSPETRRKKLMQLYRIDELIINSEHRLALLGNAYKRSRSQGNTDNASRLEAQMVEAQSRLDELHKRRDQLHFLVGQYEPQRDTYVRDYPDGLSDD